MRSGEHVHIAGMGLDGLKASAARDLDAENSGTTMRMLSGVLAGQSFTSTITGDGSLRRRPMRRVMEPLRKMGADIRSSDGDTGAAGNSRRKIEGDRVHATDAERAGEVRGAAGGIVRGRHDDGAGVGAHAGPYRIGAARIRRESTVAKGAVQIEPRPKLQARNLIVPGDLSAAVFLIGGGADFAGVAAHAA